MPLACRLMSMRGTFAHFFVMSVKRSNFAVNIRVKYKDEDTDSGGNGQGEIVAAESDE
jgi:hypothetical protein